LKNLTQEGGLGQLEGLYKVILTSFEDIDKPAQNAGRREVRLASFRHVIGTILVLQEPLTTSQIKTLLADIYMEDLDVDNFLRQMCSVLIPDVTTSFEDATPQMHRTFRDYIMDARAADQFHIPPDYAHFMTARSCVKVIVGRENQSDILREYAGQHWLHHLRRGVTNTAACEDRMMWNLLEGMVKNPGITIWRQNLMQLFVAVATAGWGLLKVRSKYARES
jgi:hypothetical protein